MGIQNNNKQMHHCFNKFTLCSLVILIIGLGELIAADPSPNIFIMTVDNLVYADLKAYNKDTQIKTPNLDKFAKQSARLTSFEE